jgi:hypothetical protein
MTRKPASVWTAAEEIALLDYLNEHLAEAGDGANFKKATFTQAAIHIAPLLKHGPEKDFKACQNKWSALKKIYKIIVALQQVSGWHWSDEHGAGITVETASSWDAYVKAHPEAKPFRNKGYANFDKIASLMPSTTPGAHVFHPTASQTMTTVPSTGNPSPSPPNSPCPPSPAQDGSAEDVDEKLPQPLLPVASSGSKASGRSAVTPSRPSRTRTSHGATALIDMSKNFAAVGQALTNALAPPSTPTFQLPPTPVRQTSAVAATLRLERQWLEKTQVVAFINILRKDKSIVDVYLAITEEDVRREFVSSLLEENGVLL